MEERCLRGVAVDEQRTAKDRGSDDAENGNLQARSKGSKIGEDDKPDRAADGLENKDPAPVRLHFLVGCPAQLQLLVQHHEGAQLGDLGQGPEQHHHLRRVVPEGPEQDEDRTQRGEQRGPGTRAKALYPAVE